MAFARPILNPLDNKTRFVLFVVGGVERNGIAFVAVRPQLFTEAAVVVFDHRVGGFENIAGGTVILLEAINVGVGKILREALDIFDFCAAPTVNGLIVIAHRGHARFFARQHTEPGVLH